MYFLTVVDIFYVDYMFLFFIVRAYLYNILKKIQILKNTKQNKDYGSLICTCVILMASDHYEYLSF